jgi:hypothetical protein
MHGGLSPDLKTMEQIRRIVRPTDVPDSGKQFHANQSFRTSPDDILSFFTPERQNYLDCRGFFFFLYIGLISIDRFYHSSVSGLLCDLLWSDPDKDIQGWGENDRGVSFTFGQVITRHPFFLSPPKRDFEEWCWCRQP